MCACGDDNNNDEKDKDPHHPTTVPRNPSNPEEKPPTKLRKEVINSNVSIENFDGLIAQGKIKKISDTEYAFSDTLDKFSLKYTNQDGEDITDMLDFRDIKGGARANKNEIIIDRFENFDLVIRSGNQAIDHLIFRPEDFTQSLTLKIKDEEILIQNGVIKKGAEDGKYYVYRSKGDVFIECVNQDEKNRLQWIRSCKVDETSGKLKMQYCRINETITVKAQSPNGTES